MIKPSLILIGAGGHARSCIDVIEQQGIYQIAGLVDLPEQRNARHLDFKVIASDAELKELAKAHRFALVAVGQIRTAEHRIRLYQQAIEAGFTLPAIIAPTAYVSRYAKVGAGTIVMHGAIVNAGVEVGINCIVNTRTLIEHDAKVNDHCHISTGATLNGNVSVGTGTFIGSGCTVKEGVAIGHGCVIGMGVNVRHNLGENTRFIGGDNV